MGFITRHLFPVDTDTGTHGDTGQPFMGSIAQMRWAPQTGDTGGDLLIALLPKAGDTGEGFVFFNDNDCLGAGFNKVPLQPGHASDGFDTGVDQYHPIVGAGDRLRIKVTPGGAAVIGTLYVWTYSG